MRILEVNNHSLLGMTHTEAVRVLRAVGDSLVMLVCDGFDPQKVAAVEVRREIWTKCSLSRTKTLKGNKSILLIT